jgi:hypothetical protein
MGQKHFRGHWKELVEMQKAQASRPTRESEEDIDDDEELLEEESPRPVATKRAAKSEPRESRFGKAREALQQYRYAAISASVAFIALSLFGALRGPTRADVDVVPVAGQVLVDGEPLSSGIINFVPPEGRGSTGVIDPQGRFTLTCLDGRDGAVLGLHGIEIVPEGPPPADGDQWKLPRSFANWQTSGVTQEITGRVTDLKIDITTADLPQLEQADGDPTSLRRD